MGQEPSLMAKKLGDEKELVGILRGCGSILNWGLRGEKMYVKCSFPFIA